MEAESGSAPHPVAISRPSRTSPGPPVFLPSCTMTAQGGCGAVGCSPSFGGTGLVALIEAAAKPAVANNSAHPLPPTARNPIFLCALSYAPPNPPHFCYGECGESRQNAPFFYIARSVKMRPKTRNRLKCRVCDPEVTHPPIR